MPKRKTQEEFIADARKVHGDKYDYSKVKYVNSSTKVCIICPEHGEFWIAAGNFLERRGCKLCSSKNRVNGLRKWNKETCREEAKKYKTKSDFARKAGAAYRLALENNWLKDYTWFVSDRVPLDYWNEETCCEASHKCKSRSDFARHFPTAYRRAHQRGWIDSYSWLVPGCTVAGYWTYERCYKEAKKYKSKKEFYEKNHRAYAAAVRNKWLDSFDWFIPQFVWTYDACLVEAKKYPTKRAFEKGNCGAYTAARRHGWINDYDWMVVNRVNVITDQIDNVYAYYFEEFNAIYVGRTIDLKRRDHEHIVNVDTDVVARFARENNCSVPIMIVLEEGITIEDGQEKEDEWLKHYKSEGYVVLNTAKTGKGLGSLGALGQGKWNRKTCYQAAKQYKSRQEFKIKNVGAYTRALERGWLDDYTWFAIPKTGQRKWTEETCYEEAKKYSTRVQFQRGCSPAYNKAKMNGWLDRYYWIATPRIGDYKWNEKSCFEEAQKYSTRKAFQIGNYSAYDKARKRGWLKNYTWFANGHKIEGEKRQKWDYESCYEEAKKYKSRKDFQYGKGSGAAYKAARENNWLKDYTWFEEKRKPAGYWTYERCYEEAKKYTQKLQFKRGSGSAYIISKRNGWLGDYKWFVEKTKPHGYWTYEHCKEEAAQYQSRADFRKGSSGAYDAALNKGWLDEFFPNKDAKNS